MPVLKLHIQMTPAYLTVAPEPITKDTTKLPSHFCIDGSTETACLSIIKGLGDMLTKGVLQTFEGSGAQRETMEFTVEYPIEMQGQLQQGVGSIMERIFPDMQYYSDLETLQRFPPAEWQKKLDGCTRDELIAEQRAFLLEKKALIDADKQALQDCEQEVERKNSEIQRFQDLSDAIETTIKISRLEIEEHEEKIQKLRSRIAKKELESKKWKELALTEKGAVQKIKESIARTAAQIEATEAIWAPYQIKP